ncbi:hypothetical protein Tco_0093859, partial [Tanacetum coccineum]
YPIWEVIQRGNGPVSVSTDRKSRTTLLMALPEDHLVKFHKMTDAKEMWKAIKSRFSGNDESKKMQNGLMSKKLGLGFEYTKKACFVYGSFSHLIRDCDFHEKRMAKQVELNNRMSKGSSQREIRQVWNNVQRVNHKNQFVPTAVLTRTGKILVSTARASIILTDRQYQLMLL